MLKITKRSILTRKKTWNKNIDKKRRKNEKNRRMYQEDCWSKKNIAEDTNLRES